MQRVHVELPVERALDRRRRAGHPDLQLRIEVERAGTLDGEAHDAPVGDRQVLDLAAGQALLVDQDQPAVGEQEDIADQPERGLDVFAVPQQAPVFRLGFSRIERAGVAHQAGEDRHRRTPGIGTCGCYHQGRPRCQGKLSPGGDRRRGGLRRFIDRHRKMAGVGGGKAHPRPRKGGRRIVPLGSTPARRPRETLSFSRIDCSGLPRHQRGRV